MPEQENSNSKDDNASFADLLDNVKPLRPSHKNTAEDYKSKPSPIPKEKLKDESKVLQESLEISPEYDGLQPGDSLSFCRPGIQKNVFRKLKKGQFSVEAELDLHGMTIVQAQAALNPFIKNCQERGIRCVRIIHGKGYRSNNQGPKLKPMVNFILRQK